MNTELLTDEQVTTLYQEKQKEDFPRRKNWLGAFYAVLFLSASMAAYLFLFWALMKLA